MKLCLLAGSHQYHRWCSTTLPSSGRGSSSTGCQYRLDQVGRRSDEEQRPAEGRSVCLTAIAEHMMHKYLHKHTHTNFCCACFASDFVQDLIPVSLHYIHLHCFVVSVEISTYLQCILMHHFMATYLHMCL